MTAVRQLPTIALLLATITLSACDHPTYFRHPLSPPGSASFDERLIGAWISRAEDTGDIYQLWITPSDAEGEDGMLRITATMTRTDYDDAGGMLLGRFDRVAYPSVVDGQTYYNVRSRGIGSQFVGLGPSGPQEPAPEEVEEFVTPAFAEREYWIAMADVSENDLLSLRFISLVHIPNDYLEDVETSSENFLSYFAIQGQGLSFWLEDESRTRYTRANLDPETLTKLVRTFPTDMVFSFSAGPFARIEAALPGYDFTELDFR